jgi:hypothetical protein
VNRAGHSQTLVAAHPGNSNRLVHGLYSKREIAPEVRELANERRCGNANLTGLTHGMP